MFAILAHQPFIVPLPLGRSPTRADWIHENPFTGQAWMSPVTAVEGHTLPVDEIARACSGHAHCVVIVHHPRAAFAHATGAVVEPYCDPLLRDITGRDLQRPKQLRPEFQSAI